MPPGLRSRSLKRDVGERSRTQRRAATLAAVLALGFAAATTGVAAASSPPVSTGGTMTAVPQGIGAAAISSTPPFGTTPPNTPVTVSFVLKAQNLSALEQSVESGAHPLLSPSQFAALYGQSPWVISQLESYLGRFGITSSAFSGDLDVVANGTAGEFNRALEILLHEYNIPAHHWGPNKTTPAQQIFGTTQSPRLPSVLASYVLSILGLTNWSGAFASNAVRSTEEATDASSPSGTIPVGELTPANFEQNYDVTPLYNDGDTGQGQTIGIVTFASVDPKVPETFWTKYLHLATAPNRISLVNVDGGSGAVSLDAGSDETTLDVEQSGAIAPNANIIVYQAPNTDSGGVDALFEAAEQDSAGTISSSWGDSETYYQLLAETGSESSTYVQAQDEGFLELAMQGEAFFSASGDSGAYDATDDAGTTNLAVDNPSDSPYVTSAGATTLAGPQVYPSPTGGASCTVDVPAQRTWGWDYQWPCWAQLGGTSETEYAPTDVVGSGGGFSVDEATPSYQQGIFGTHQFSAVEYLTPTDYSNQWNGDSLGSTQEPFDWNLNLTPSVTTGSASGRAVPDVSVDGDPETGYALYDPQYTSLSICGVTQDQPCGPVLQFGGTSFSAPQLNGVAALIDEYVGKRTGFWNPGIYYLARSSGSPFTPLDATGTSNDNVYFTGTAGAIYNPGSGLGTPDVFALANDAKGLVG